jgi:threonine dehydrogenase-like Zn-dependent dehydrogenase
LERLVLASPVLQRVIVRVHERAFRRVLPEIGEVRTVTIVGGGLFPRTALVLRRLLPGAQLTVVDKNAAHLDLARVFLGNTVTLRRELFDPSRRVSADLVVAPLAYIGDRRRLYDLSAARAVAVHDWIWSRRGRSVVVSWLLLKRLNLVMNADPASVRKAAS